MKIDEDAQFIFAILLGIAVTILCIGIAFGFGGKRELNHPQTTNQVEKP